MPEGPEVVLLGQMINKHLKNKIITKFTVLHGRYKKKPEALKGGNLFEPAKCLMVKTKGKFIVFVLATIAKNNKDADLWFMSTLGMTGLWTFVKPEVPVFKITYFDGLEKKYLWYQDERNFGTFQITNDMQVVKRKWDELKPDAVKSDFSLQDVKKYKQKIVSLLMDQKKLVSGLGNYLVAEILYRAKISPYRPGLSLTNDDIDELKYAIKYVTKASYSNGHTGYMQKIDPETKGIKRIDYHPKIEIDEKDIPFTFKIYRRKIDPLRKQIVGSKILPGRTTYWVPDIQK